MWTLSTSVVPSGWFAGVFLFSVTVSCPFPSRFFGQSLSCSTGGHCWTMWISRGIRFGTFRCLTVISVVHIEAYMLTLRLQLLEVFRLHVMPRHVFEIKRRKRKPVKHQFFQTSSFWFCDFWNALNVMQKPFRNVSCLGTVKICTVLRSIVDQRSRELAVVFG